MLLQTLRKYFYGQSDRAKINNITCTACRGGKIKSYESVVKETAEIIADTEFYNGLRKSIKEDKEGKAIPWEEVKKEL